MSKLFSAARMGDLTLRNRIVMAPLTRCRASPGRVPNDMNVEYYAQRSSVGLILTEATSVCPMGVGYPNTPGIWSKEQVEGWKKVTKKVHDLGGTIFLQLWHVGRISDPDLYLNGKLPVSASAIACPGHINLVRPKKNYVTPRALEIEEIPGVIAEYKKGAENAQLAGFDGVEVHSANGYLPDQFLQSGSNKRTDEYGGPIENRARFALEVTDAVISVWGPDRTGVHIAPRGDYAGMGDDNPKETFGYLAKELRKRKIAFMFAREKIGKDSLGPSLKKIFGGFFIANEQLTKESAEKLLESNSADAASFGQLIIANPDLVHRFKSNTSLNTPNPSTYYSPGPQGYTDYPFLK